MIDVVASWSGGIDSTAVIANLLARGFSVRAVTLLIYGGAFNAREQRARESLKTSLRRLARLSKAEIEFIEKRADWIWAFSPDGIEIPRRNKHIIDHLITTEMIPEKIKKIGMGEYIGADTWLVKDHVSAADADHRSLSAYIYQEYGLDYQLISLQNFGESRYKSDRINLGMSVLGTDMFLCSNCLVDSPLHCGSCYKCIERAAAYHVLDVEDKTDYEEDPKNKPTFSLYVHQMRGNKVEASFEEVRSEKTMPSKFNSGE